MSSAIRPSAEMPSLESALMAAPEGAERLAQILELEFEALKTRDLSAFDAVQDEKLTVMQKLATLAQRVAEQTAVPTVWQDLQASLQQSKQDHLRNIQLLQRQLQAVQGTLQTLQGNSGPTVDLYDRMGRIARRQGDWGVQLA